MSITAYENLLSTAERRALRAGDDKTTLRLSDFMGIYPITGKVELVYEGEQEGAAYVAQNLIASAIHTFSPVILKSKEKPDENAYTDLIEWFLLKAVLNYWMMLQMKNMKEFRIDRSFGNIG
jgi:magnesium chelatase subunit I